MKKILMMAAVASLAIVACDKKDDGGEKPKPAVNSFAISATPTTLKVSESGTITVTAKQAVEEDVTFTISTDLEGHLTLGSQSATIAKGGTKADVTFRADAAGTVKVTIANADVTITTTTVSINIQNAEETDWVSKDYDYPISSYWTYGILEGIEIGDESIECDVTSSAYYFYEDADCVNFFFNSKPYIQISRSGATMVVNFDITGSYPEGPASGDGDKYWIDVYFDWNADGDFADAGESLGKESYGASTKSRTLTVTPPAGANKFSVARVIYAFDGTGGEAYVPNAAMDSGAFMDFVYELVD